MTTKTKPDVCSICGKPGWPDGNHNAQPINDGRCCGICNITVVIPRRLADLHHRLLNNKE